MVEQGTCERTVIWVYLVVAVCLVLVDGTTYTNGLTYGGRNVCSSGTSEFRRYSTTSWTFYYTVYAYTSCGFLWLKRCRKTRGTYSYRRIYKSRKRYVTILSCCNGWKKSYSRSTDCSVAICSQGCRYGSCVSPNNCQCRTGWTDNSCNTDIDECATSNGGCDIGCVNTQGSYYCTCPTGYNKNGTRCEDLDECALSHHSCQDKCNNYHGGHSCSCNIGYELNSDNRTCSDVDECLPISMKAMNNTMITIIPAGCDQLCQNIPANYTCSCNPGYFLLYDGKRCIDINECTAGSHSCDHICYNTPGSYECLCHQGYKLKPNKRSCEETCTPPWTELNKRCFKVINVPTRRWKDAFGKCRSLQSSMAFIGSQTDNNFVANLAKIKRNETVRLWLGLRKAYARADFKWVDGRRPDNYTNWAPGEPKSIRKRALCTEMLITNSFHLEKWNVVDCENRRLKSISVCEKAL